MAKVLVVEDDVALAATIEDWLVLEHHVVDVVVNGAKALELLKVFQYELIILDWDLPEVDGLEVLTKHRESGGLTPILMLTGKGAIEEKEKGLDAGADDYLTKPFHPKELSARLRALLRRPAQACGNVLKFRDIVLEPSSMKVTKEGKEIIFQRHEVALLEFLMRHPREIFSTEALLSRVWDSDADVSIDALYQCIKRIRKKLDSSESPSVIRTVHGIGYTMEG